MSPTVPPTSTMTTSAPLSSAWAPHAGFYLVGDVGDGLDGASQIVASALLGDDGAIDGAGGDIGGAGEVDIDESFVVAEVEVGLATVLGDEDLAVLVGGHGAGVYIEVGVEFLDGYVDTVALEDAADGGNGDALANRADDSTGNEYEFSGQHQASGGVMGRSIKNDGRGVEGVGNPTWLSMFAKAEGLAL